MLTGEPVSGAAALNIVKKALEVNLYPNPAKDQITLLTNAEESQDLLITITDLSGRTISSTKVITKDFMSKLDLNLINGAYLLHISNSNNEKVIKKLLISK